MKLKKLAIVFHRSAAVGTNLEMSVLTMSKKSSFFPLFSQFLRVSENPISYLIQFLEDAFEFIL